MDFHFCRYTGISIKRCSSPLTLDKSSRRDIVYRWDWRSLYDLTNCLINSTSSFGYSNPYFVGILSICETCILPDWDSQWFNTMFTILTRNLANKLYFPQTIVKHPTYRIGDIWWLSSANKTCLTFKCWNRYDKYKEKRQDFDSYFIIDNK